MQNNQNNVISATFALYFLPLKTENYSNDKVKRKY
jgi:hypothetical protein